MRRVGSYFLFIDGDVEQPLERVYFLDDRAVADLANAKGKGVYTGRKTILTPKEAQELRKRVAAGEDKAAIAKAFGISRASVYNYMAQ